MGTPEQSSPPALLAASLVLLDGATATALHQRGQVGFRTPEILNLVAPEAVLDLQREYVRAGAQAILTNTFGANRFRLAAIGRADQLREICRLAARIARTAAGQSAAVLGDIGPIRFYANELGVHSPSELRSAYSEVAESLLDAGVDALLLETLPSLDEACLAFGAIREVARDAPILVSCFFRRVDGHFRTADNAAAADVVRILRDRGAYAAGANCCLGVGEMTAILDDLSAVGWGSLIAKPNAGLPQQRDGRIFYPEGPEKFAQAVRDWVDKGARFIGGCCGTGPEHIRALRRVLEQIVRARQP